MSLLDNKRRARSQIQVNTGLHALGYLGLGAGLMYFLDPDRGRRRRTLVRDQMAHADNVLGDAAVPPENSIRLKHAGFQ
jgi:hypothetical protein